MSNYPEPMRHPALPPALQQQAAWEQILPPREAEHIRQQVARQVAAIAATHGKAMAVRQLRNQLYSGAIGDAFQWEMQVQGYLRAAQAALDEDGFNHFAGVVYALSNQWVNGQLGMLSSADSSFIGWMSESPIPEPEEQGFFGGLFKGLLGR